MRMHWFLSVFVLSTSLSTFAREETTDPYHCSETAVKAAIAIAKQYKNGAEITYNSVTTITPFQNSVMTKYEINLAQWLNDDSFGLTYEVIVKGQ